MVVIDARLRASEWRVREAPAAIAALRQSLGMSLGKFAQELHHRPTVVRDWESGQFAPNWANITGAWEYAQRNGYTMPEMPPPWAQRWTVPRPCGNMGDS